MAGADKVKQIYNRVAGTYDATAGMKFVDGLRAEVFRQARGDVLELGVGTGATFPHYPREITSLTALDISEGMLERAEAQARLLECPVRFMVTDFQKLDFPDGSFD